MIKAKTERAVDESITCEQGGDICRGKVPMGELYVVVAIGNEKRQLCEGCLKSLLGHLQNLHGDYLADYFERL